MVQKFFLSERNILLAIMINSIIIFLLYFPQIEKGHPDIFSVLENIDHLFVIVFLIEVIIKLRKFGFKQYFKNKWNIFDCLIAILSIPSILTFLPFFIGLNYSFIRVLRLIRIIRLMRLISFIPHMDSILSGLGRAIKASVFILIALILLNFIFAIFTCHLYGHLVPQYFGDPMLSSYHIFQLFTIEGWDQIPIAIAESIESNNLKNPYILINFTRFYFIIIVLTGGIFGMSLANAIFVDEMTMDNNKEMEKKLDFLIQKITILEEKLDKKNENPSEEKP